MAESVELRRNKCSEDTDTGCNRGTLLGQYDAVLRAARSLVGIPFVLGGRDEKKADCAGLVVLFYKKLGIDIPLSACELTYSDIRQIAVGCDVMVRRCRNFFRIYPVEDGKCVVQPKPGDILLFHHDTRNVSTHIGIFIDNFQFLHTEENKKSRIVKMTRPLFHTFRTSSDNVWSRRLSSLGKYRGKI